MNDRSIEYSLENDSEVFIHESFSFGSNKVQVDACTVSGSKDGVTKKPNEDSFSIFQRDTILLAAVFDGASSQKPIAALGDLSGARFASHFLKTTLESHDLGERPEDIVRNLNKELLLKISEFPGANLDDVHTLPASTATIVQFDFENNSLNISHVGDTFCLLIGSTGQPSLVTIDKNKKYDDDIYNLVRSIAKEQGISPREAKEDERVKRAIADMFQDTFNKPDGTGQGIINGDPKVEQYIQDISVPLHNIQAVLIGSDGLVPPGLDEQNLSDRKLLLQTIADGNLEKLIQLKHSSEDEDKDWNHVRFKHSDDATGIFIRL